MGNWYVYIVQCIDGTLYTGITNNIDKRVKLHNSGNGARYTSSRKPVKLVWHEDCKSKSKALKREIEIKALRRDDKLALVKTLASEN